MLPPVMWIGARPRVTNRGLEREFHGSLRGLNWPTRASPDFFARYGCSPSVCDERVSDSSAAPIKYRGVGLDTQLVNLAVWYGHYLLGRYGSNLTNPIRVTYFIPIWLEFSFCLTGGKGDLVLLLIIRNFLQSNERHGPPRERANEVQ